jgi:hypothetical protein
MGADEVDSYYHVKKCEVPAVTNGKKPLINHLLVSV